VILYNHDSSVFDHIDLIDPSADVQFETRIRDGFVVRAWRTPRLYDILCRGRLWETAFVVREFLTTLRLIGFAAREGVCTIKSATHECIALRGYFVSIALGQPHVIDVAGNYELLRRLLGYTYYLNSFYRVLGLKTIARLVNNWLLCIPLRQAFRVLGRNKNNYEHAFALGAPIERLSLVRIRVSDEFLHAEFKPPSPLKQRYILFVARMAPEKFPFDVIEAFEQIANRIPDMDLVLIGGGPHLKVVQERSAQSTYCKRIHVIGPLPNLEVFQWTCHATLAVELYSGSSLVEKMLCGIPVVAYDVEWMSEVIIDGYTGFLVDFRDVASLALRCLHIASAPEEAHEMGARAKALTRIMFDRTQIIEKEDAVFRRAIAHFRSRHNAQPA
jgi:glycosyltransferase involved in cell wall biosynthesis